MTKILLVDNVPRDAERFRSLLAKDGIEVVICSTGAEAGHLLAEEEHGYRAAVVLWELPGMPSGFELLRLCRRRSPGMPVVVISGALDATLALRAVEFGAQDFLEKPYDSARLRACIQGLFGARAPESPLVGQLRQKLLGESPIWMETLRQVASVIPDVDARVLLIGESGVGKELLAQEIHRLGPRAATPMVSVNIAETAPSLVESALFGHEKGAFTDAVNRHEGYLEEAGKGTLFLDEVGELTLELQVKLLRVMQERLFRRVGGDRPMPFEARIIAATNRDLVAEVNAGRFRLDLFHRLAEVTIQVPPLRDRTGDIDLLLDHFLRTYRGARTVEFGRETRSILRSYSFRGNVRELENTVKSALLKCNGDTIQPRDLPLQNMSGLFRGPEIAPQSESAAATRELLSPDRRALVEEMLGSLPGDWLEKPYRDAVQPYAQAFDRVYLQRKLESRRHNVSQAARDAGIDAKTFRKRWREAGLPPLGGDEGEE